MLEWLKRRVVERSTWVGLLTLIGILGVEISPELKDEIITAITAVVAVLFTISADRARARASDGNKPGIQAGSAATNLDTGQQ
jgi:hypothetical protein